MEKVSKEDAVILENFALKEQMLSFQKNAFLADMKSRYKLEDGDQFNPQTLEIIRAPKAEPEAKKE